jgi:drug/metabolite transporter (DMT)-like permease
VASLTTTLAPFFILVLSIAFLGEKLTARRALGFGLCILGMGVISFARRGGGAAAYPVIVAVTALAPLSWSCFSVLTKPVTRTVDPVHWTYLALVVGSLPALILLPWWGGPEMASLDATGWAAILYLALLATVAGFAIWTWLLRHLPASTVGLTIFLNPPLTTISKAILAAAIPTAIVFRMTSLEGIGGAIVLLGLAVGLLQRRSAGALLRTGAALVPGTGAVVAPAPGATPPSATERDRDPMAEHRRPPADSAE